MYGLNPRSISSRIAKKTYGINTLTTFDPERHPEEKKVRLIWRVLGGGINNPLNEKYMQNLSINHEHIFVMFSLIWRKKNSKLNYYSIVNNHWLVSTSSHSILVFSVQVVIEGEDFCEDVFDAFVRKGDSVGADEIHTKTYCPVRTRQTVMRIIFYCTESKDADFVDEDGVKQLGELCIDIGKPF